MNGRVRAALGAGIVAVALACAAVIPWAGNGSENVPCASGAHWVLAPAQGITSATVTVDGHSFALSQNGNGSFAADDSTPVTEQSVVTFTFEGQNDKAHLQLSHCLGGGSPSPTISPTPTESPSPSESPSPTESPTPTESSSPSSSPSASDSPTPSPTESSTPSPTPTESSSTPPPSPSESSSTPPTSPPTTSSSKPPATHSGGTHTPGPQSVPPTAETGLSDTGRAMVALAVVLLVLGLGLLWVARALPKE